MGTIDQDQILRLHESGGLLEAISGRFDRLDQAALKDVVQVCAKVHNTGLVDFLALLHSDAFDTITSSDFFSIQIFYVDLIPYLEATPDAVMLGVQVLVEKAGNDLAANQPNAALLLWCRNNLDRARDILHRALAGDTLATDHLTFALQALNDLSEARRICREFDGKLRWAAISALGRIRHADIKEGAETLALFSTVIETDRSDQTLTSCMGASPDILSTTGTIDAAGGLELLASLLSSGNPQVLYYAASGLFGHPSVFTDVSRTLILQPMLSVDRSHKGIVDFLDSGLNRMMESEAREQASEFVRELLVTRGKEFTIEQFDGYGRALIAGDLSHFYKTFVAWMFSGDRHLCTAMSDLLQDIENGGQPIDIPTEFLPKEDWQQVFLAQKVIGYFFVAPVTAASVLLSLLRTASPDGAAELTRLLIDPLLLNYGGDLVAYLKKVAETDPVFGNVSAALARREEYVGHLDSVGVLKELLPSEVQRSRERRRANDEMRRSYKAAQKKSVFLNLVKRSVQLYGRRSVTMLAPPGGGARKPMEMELKSYGMSAELPRLTIIDPVGLDYQLRVFRNMQVKK